MKKYFIAFSIFLLLIMITVSANVAYATGGITVPIQTNKANTPVKVATPACIALMYHKLSENPNDVGAFCITPEDFEADIIYLKEQGYQFYTASELPNLTEDQWGTAVFLTFDDGYESDLLYLLPILEKHNVKATIFVLGSMLGEEEHITKEQLAELAQSPLVEIGSHSYDIHHLTPTEAKEYYETEDADTIAADFLKNALFIEEIIGKPVRSLSYPNGIWTIDADNALRKLGFVATFTSEEKMIRGGDSPAGRYNRPSIASAQAIIERATQKDLKQNGKWQIVSTSYATEIKELKEQKYIQTTSIRQMLGQ